MSPFSPDHRSYFSSDECREVHRIYEEAVSRVSPDAWLIGYDQFQPDEEMNEPYFLQE